MYTLIYDSGEIAPSRSDRVEGIPTLWEAFQIANETRLHLEDLGYDTVGLVVRTMFCGTLQTIFSYNTVDGWQNLPNSIHEKLMASLN